VPSIFWSILADPRLKPIPGCTKQWSNTDSQKKKHTCILF
jgi:hypothetical protein